MGFLLKIKRASKILRRGRSLVDRDDRSDNRNPRLAVISDESADVSGSDRLNFPFGETLDCFVQELRTSVASGNTISKDERVKEAIKEAILLLLTQVPSDEMFALVSQSMKLQAESCGENSTPSPKSPTTDDIDISMSQLPSLFTSPPHLMEDVRKARASSEKLAGLIHQENGNAMSKSMLDLNEVQKDCEDASGTGLMPQSNWTLSASAGKIPEGLSPENAFELLQKVFPVKALSQMLKWDMGDSIAEYHKDVSVFFSDIVGFTDWCASVTPTTVITCLSAYFQILDDLAEQSGVYKVETIGDAWMATCGAPKAEPYHAETMANFALQVLETLSDLREIFHSPVISLRIGLHCGPVVSGVVRADRPRWQLFGDTVNMASRMESTGCPDCVQISQDMYDALKRSSSKFTCVSRGTSEIKGKGLLETYFLLKAKAPTQVAIDRLTLFNEEKHSKFKNSNLVSLNSMLEKEESSKLPVIDDNPFTSITKKLLRLNLIQKPTELRSRSRSITFSEGSQPDELKTRVTNNLRALEIRGSDSVPSSPMYQMASSSGLSRKMGSTENANQLAILIVDDNVSILMQYQRLLRRTGFDIYTARNGQEALVLMKERTFVVVFMDIHLPGMSGFEIVRHFREWESCSRTWKQPIIGLSGSSREEFFVKAREHFGSENVEFHGYIQKNNNKNVVMRNVATCLLLLP